MKNSFARFLLAAILLVSAAGAQAQTYPSRQITLVVPFAAGGPVDFLGRRLLVAGIEPATSSSPEEFTAFVRSQAETRSKVIQAVGLKLD